MVLYHITVNKNVLSVSLNKTFPSFLLHRVEAHRVIAAGFFSRYLNGRHITVNENVLSASLNETFPSFLALGLVVGH